MYCNTLNLPIIDIRYLNDLFITSLLSLSSTCTATSRYVPGTRGDSTERCCSCANWNSLSKNGLLYKCPSLARTGKSSGIVEIPQVNSEGVTSVLTTG